MDIDEYGSMFEDCMDENTESTVPLPIQNIIKSVESEFEQGTLNTPIESEKESREKEVEKINTELKKLSAQLHHFRNVKNTKRTTTNELLSRKRDDIRRRIQFLKVRLDEIKMEIM